MRYIEDVNTVHAPDTGSTSTRDLRRQLDVERRAREDAEENNRLKDEFLAVISHELRTPLAAIMGWTEIMRQSDGSPLTFQEGLELIERSAKRQQRLIEDLLDISRANRGTLALELDLVDLTSLAFELSESLRPDAVEKGVELQLIAPDNEIFMVADPDRLSQVLSNLISNAIKFTPRGGKIEVEIGTAGEEVTATVRDNGIGIEPRFLPHVFDRYHQGQTSSSHQRQTGLGLGLAIARQIVALHGGVITATSPGIGKGTTFQVRLPVGQIPQAD